jgi:transcription elongation factor GreB
VYIKFVSKAFTRESDELPESPRMKPASVLPFGVKNYFTSQGIARLRQEVQKLHSTPASPVSRQRAYEIERSLDSAVLIEPPPKPWKQVSFGATVTVRDQENAQHVYRIVGVDEIDLNDNCISWLSPIAKALNKKRVGENVRFRIPDGEQVLEIMDITFQE